MKQLLVTCLWAVALLFLGSCKNQGKGPEVPKLKSMSIEKSSAMDAVRIAPTHYKLMQEKQGIRVLEVNYQPGESSAMHSHPDNVLYVVNNAKAEFTEKDGTKHTEEMKKGTSRVIPAGTHSVKNVGTTPMKAYLFEINRPDVAMMRDASLDAEKVAPAQYKVLQDSMNIRILMLDFKPGESSGYHAHPVNAVYVIAPGKLEFTSNGRKLVEDLKQGMTEIYGRGSHSVKNVGKTECKMLVVEVNRM